MQINIRIIALTTYLKASFLLMNYDPQRDSIIGYRERYKKMIVATVRYSLRKD